MAYIVDRLEGEAAVLLNQDTVLEVQKNDLAEDVREGDAVFLKDGVWQKDESETAERKKWIEKKMNALWE